VAGDVIHGSQQAIRSFKGFVLFDLLMTWTFTMTALSAGAPPGVPIGRRLTAAAVVGLGLLVLPLRWRLLPRMISTWRIEVDRDEVRWHSWFRRRDRLITRADVVSSKLGGTVSKPRLHFCDDAGHRVGTVALRSADATDPRIRFDAREVVAALRRHGWPTPGPDDVMSGGALARWRRRKAA
jgi:hypothetical protein